MSLMDIPRECLCEGRGFFIDEETGMDKRCFCTYVDRALTRKIHSDIPSAFRALDGQFVLDQGYGFSDDTDRSWWDAIVKDPASFTNGNGIQLVCEDQEVRMAFAMHAAWYIMLGGLPFAYFDWSRYAPSFWQHWREDIHDMYKEMREASGLILDNFNGIVGEDKQISMSTFGVDRFCWGGKFTILASRKPIPKKRVGHDFYNYMVKRCGFIRLVEKEQGEEVVENG